MGRRFGLEVDLLPCLRMLSRVSSGLNLGG